MEQCCIRSTRSLMLTEARSLVVRVSPRRMSHKRYYVVNLLLRWALRRYPGLASPVWPFPLSSLFCSGLVFQSFASHGGLQKQPGSHGSPPRFQIHTEQGTVILQILSRGAWSAAVRPVVGIPAVKPKNPAPGRTSADR